jgi:hypothetical protein
LNIYKQNPPTKLVGFVLGGLVGKSSKSANKTDVKETIQIAGVPYYDRQEDVVIFTKDLEDIFFI